MKILVLDEEFPYPLNNGKRLRSFSLTRALAAHARVEYLAYGSSDSEAAAALRAEGIICHPVAPPDRRKAGPAFYLKLLLNLLSPLPYIVTSHTTRRYARRLRELLESEPFDAVICEWTPYANFLREHPEQRSIIVAHNIESQIWRRYEANERNPIRRWYIAIQRAKVERFEQDCFHWVRGATAVSRIEAEEIAHFGVDYRVEVVDNGVDVDFFHPMDHEVDPDRIVFSGALDWRPNQDAVEYFVHEILPRIRERRPGAHFAVVGREPPRHVRDLDRVEGVSITGTVDDVRPYLASAALCAVPLRIGGGSRLKILAAMAMGRPVVSTTIGAEGLEVHDGEDIVLADGAADFAEAVLRGLEDSERMARIARAGRDLVERRYRWDSLGARLHTYVTEIVTSDSGRR